MTGASREKVVAMIRAFILAAVAPVLLFAACGLPSDIVGPTDPALPRGYQAPGEVCPTPEQGADVSPPC